MRANCRKVAGKSIGSSREWKSGSVLSIVSKTCPAEPTGGGQNEKRPAVLISASRFFVRWLGCRDSNPNLLIQSQLSCQLDDTPVLGEILPQSASRGKFGGFRRRGGRVKGPVAEWRLAPRQSARWGWLSCCWPAALWRRFQEWRSP